TPASRVLGPWSHVSFLTGSMVLTCNKSSVGTCVYDLRIPGTWRDPAAFAAPDVVPVRPLNAAVTGASGDSHRGVVLLRAVYVVREIIVQRDAIKLSRGLVVDRAPASASVKAHLRAAVIAHYHSR